jgi:hypothetical protein
LRDWGESAGWSKWFTLKPREHDVIHRMKLVSAVEGAEANERRQQVPVIIRIALLCFVGCAGDETILCPTKPFSALAQKSGNPSWLSSDQQGTAPGADDRRTGDRQMRTMSFILAFAFVMAATSMAGSAETGLPGIGTFSYNGSPVTTTSHALVVAAR